MDFDRLVKGRKPHHLIRKLSVNEEAKGQEALVFMVLHLLGLSKGHLLRLELTCVCVCVCTVHL